MSAEFTSPAIPAENNLPPAVAVSIRPPRREVLLAGIPHLWFGVAIVLANLIHRPNDSSPGSSVVLLALFLGTSAGVAIFAWRHAWPLWTAAWYSYAFWLLPVAFAYFLYQLGIDSWVLNSIIALGSIAAIGIGYLLLFRSSRLHALLVALFLVPVASQLSLESIPEGWEAFIALLFGLLAGLASGFAVWTRDWPRAVSAALLTNLCAGVVLTYICFYQVEIPGFYGEGVLAVVMFLAGYLAAAFVLFLGPWFFWGGWEWMKRRTRWS